MVLVMTLFLMVLLAISGLAFLSIQTAQRDAAKSELIGEQARQLALSGLHDARQKLSLNFQYFNNLQEGQEVLTFVEQLNGPAGTSGSYEVTIDMSQSKRPFFLVLVRSTGIVGDTSEPLGQRTLEVEIDVCPSSRDGTNAANPNLFQVLWSEDRGGL